MCPPCGLSIVLSTLKIRESRQGGNRGDEEEHQICAPRYTSDGVTLMSFPPKLALFFRTKICVGEEPHTCNRCNDFVGFDFPV